MGVWFIERETPTLTSAVHSASLRLCGWAKFYPTAEPQRTESFRRENRLTVKYEINLFINIGPDTDGSVMQYR